MNNSSIHQVHLDVTSKQTENHQQTEQSSYILKPNQKVYLYGDTSFAGTLIRPLERTYPSRWTVELDRGGYDSATVSDITPINPQYIESNLAIPFDDGSEISPHHERVQLEEDNEVSEKEREILLLETKIAQLEQENEILKKDLEVAKQVIRRAKDISPLMRISLKRVLRLAKDACLDVRRTVGGWILLMGNKARKFKRLVDIWDILSQDNWFLSEIFAPDKLIAIDLIQPPKPRKLPIQYYPKQPKVPFPITREDLLVQRELGSFRY